MKPEPLLPSNDQNDDQGETFRNDVFKGLNSAPKYLQSKYFYDQKGDKIFQKIMELQEYYPTRCEEEILRHNKSAILRNLCEENETFQLVELGCGDGQKTKILLRHFLDCSADFTYVPIDISGNVLRELKKSLGKEFPSLKVNELEGDYFTALRELKDNGTKKLILFMGANIGNFTRKEALGFMRELADKLGEEDQLLVGFDLRKNPAIIEKAYNDSQGITRDFNMNLLHRINRELGADFDTSSFIHYPVYDPVTGEMKSFLLSTRKQEIYISAFERKFFFKAWEAIQTEVSVKYDIWEINELAAKTGLRIKDCYYDTRSLFVNVMFEKK